MSYQRNILITGGAGFIGSHVVRLFVNKYPEYHIVNLDKLTYAGNLANLHDIESAPNYTFIKADICDFDKMVEIFSEYQIDGVIHLAAESHVDRSIKDPFTFAQTNVMGTLSLLQVAKLTWEVLPDKYEGKRFYQQMRCTAHCSLMGHSLQSLLNTIHIVPILRAKRVAIILSGLITIHMDYQLL